MSQVKLVSECFVRPKTEVPDSKKHHHLSPLALNLISLGNTQYGLLFATSSSDSNLFENLKSSLSQALVYFYPLAGRLVTNHYDDEHCSSIFVDCAKGPGARLIHASARDLSISDIINLNEDVPLVVQSFFDLGERQVNHDGHTRALLSLQMTELNNGVFIGCCINHCIADGTSLSHFLNILSQIFVNENVTRLPVFKAHPSLSIGHTSIIKLPCLDADEFVTRFDEGYLRDRIFRFSNESMKSLKAKANAEAKIGDSQITLSSFKALCAHIWMSITRARKLEYNEQTTFALAVNVRPRLSPPLSQDYFGSAFTVAIVSVKVGDLLTNGLGWATMLIHKKVEEIDHKVALEKFVSSHGKNLTVETPGFVSLGANPVVMGGSPWFDLYGAEFGLGRPVAVRTGYTNRADGKLTAFPGQSGPGSVDLQVGLFPENMDALLLDEGFMKYVS